MTQKSAAPKKSRAWRSERVGGGDGMASSPAAGQGGTTRGFGVGGLWRGAGSGQLVRRAHGVRKGPRAAGSGPQARGMAASVYCLLAQLHRSELAAPWHMIRDQYEERALLARRTGEAETPSGASSAPPGFHAPSPRPGMRARHLRGVGSRLSPSAHSCERFMRAASLLDLLDAPPSISAGLRQLHLQSGGQGKRGRHCWAHQHSAVRRPPQIDPLIFFTPSCPL